MPGTVMAGGEETERDDMSLDDLDVIEVRGIRAAQEAALSVKRHSDAVVDVVTAEDIGQFPDHNVAESLSRVTGIGVTREFGEGEKITVRGAGPAHNRTLLNGQTIATADWFILDDPVRSFNYTMLPSALVSALEVYKSPMASLDEGSIGGAVYMRTHRPLNLDAHTTHLGAELQYSEASSSLDPQAYAMYSWKNDNEDFGVLVSAIRQDREVVREGIEILGWPHNEEHLDGQRVPSHVGAPRFEQQRERQTFFGSMQWEPTDRLTFTLNSLHSEVNADNQNSNWLIFVNNDAEALTDISSVDNSVVAGRVPDTGMAAYNFINRKGETKTRSTQLQADYHGDQYNLEFQIGSTRASGGTLRETSWEYGMDTGYDFDLTGSVPYASTEGDASNPANLNAGWIWGGERPTTDAEDYLQLDVDMPLHYGIITDLHFGAKYRDAERTQDRTAYSWHGPGTMADEDLAPNYLDYIFATCPTMADCGLATGPLTVDAVMRGNLTEQFAHDRRRMEEIAFEGLDGVPADFARSLILAENWAVEEEITAVYLQADFASLNYRGNIGVRYVDTRQTSGGYEFSEDSFGLWTIDREWLTPETLEWRTERNNYQEVLPSFNFAYDLRDDTVLRFSLARVMARQNWNDISTSISHGSLNVAQPTGTASNPHLEPIIADQLDLAYEWYFAPQSLLAATFFYKDVDSYRSFSTFVDERFWEEEEEFVDVTFTRPENGPGGVTRGLELSYQQAITDNIGVIANYTYTSASRREERDPSVPGSGLIEGPSDHMYNLTAYYETDQFSARAMYNYRTEWYKGLHFNGDELWNDSFGQLDLSLSYNLNENVSFVFDAINLTDEKVVEYNTDRSRLFSIYQNGRRFVLGVRSVF
ncbi:TonB-dependent receptor [Wenzhouxiangella sp. AB-CW3]|nr:TonB-dependent receptor [Wenzhouxiangella sp. AB-CW3]